MIDIGFSGPRFTWTNKRKLQALIQERIDRFFVNASWCLLYPDAKVVHLTRCNSHHCPVMLNMLPTAPTLKFQTYWLTDPTFPKVVSQAWRMPNDLEEVIDNFTKEDSAWNKLHFGNIFSKKKNIKTRLNGIQRAVCVKPSMFLLNLEK